MEFTEACKTGNLQEAIRLQGLGANIRARDYSAFRYSCENGHFEIAKWLHSLGADIHTHHDFAFRHSCEYGHFEIAKWLQGLIDTNLQSKNSLIKESSEIFTKLIKVNIASDTELFYSVNGKQYMVKLVKPIMHHISECTVKIGSNKYNIVSNFSDNPLDVISKECCNINIPAETIIEQNGILIKLVNEQTFTLAKTFKVMLPKGTKLQNNSAQLILDNEVLCECECI